MVRVLAVGALLLVLQVPASRPALAAGGFDYANGVCVQKDGKVVAVGTTSTGNDIAIVRHEAGGALDDGFSGDGKLTRDLGGSDQAWDVAVDRQGRILVAGSTNAGGTNDFAVLRYLPDGSPDGAFGTDGAVVADLGGSEIARGIALDRRGRILLAGSSTGPDGMDTALARYLEDGTPDPDFGGGDGEVVVDLGGEDGALDVVLDKKGSIFAAGSGDGGGTGDFLVAKFDAAGDLDEDFGDGSGLAFVDLGGNEVLGAVALTKRKAVLLCGTRNGGGTYYALARLDRTGVLDPSFGPAGTGKVLLSGGRAHAMVADRKGRATFAGQTDDGGDPLFVVGRTLADGTLDPAFGEGGLRSHRRDLSTTNYWYGIAAGKKGAVHAAGLTAGDLAVAKYDKTGTLDPTFLDDQLNTVVVTDF
jgi:uncharacterized delta-60 repeat protein